MALQDLEVQVQHLGPILHSDLLQVTLALQTPVHLGLILEHLRDYLELQLKLRQEAYLEQLR